MLKELCPAPPSSQQMECERRAEGIGIGQTCWSLSSHEAITRPGIGPAQQAKTGCARWKADGSRQHSKGDDRGAKGHIVTARRREKYSHITKVPRGDVTFIEVRYVVGLYECSLGVVGLGLALCHSLGVGVYDLGLKVDDLIRNDLFTNTVTPYASAMLQG